MSIHPTTIRTRRWREKNREENRRRSAIYDARYRAKSDDRRKYQRWSDQEDRLILSGDVSDVEISKQLGRTLAAIQDRRRLLKTGSVSAAPCTRKPWKRAEEEALRQMASLESSLGWNAWVKIAAAMQAAGWNRTASACSSRYMLLKGHVYKRARWVPPTE